MNPTVPPLEIAERAYELARDQHLRATERQRHLEQEIKAVELELTELGRAVEGAVDHPRRLESFRAKRSAARTRLADLREELAPVSQKVEATAAEMQTAEADFRNAQRITLQSKAAGLSSQIRTLIDDLEDRLLHFGRLAEQDRQAKDRVRSLEPDQMSAVPSFHWGSNTDEAFLDAINVAIQERARIQRQLIERVA